MFRRFGTEPFISGMFVMKHFSLFSLAFDVVAVFVVVVFFLTFLKQARHQSYGGA